jgi:hypothetical protein
MWVDFMTLYFNEALNFDGRFQIFKQHMQKKVIQMLDPFLSFMFCFQHHKVHTMLAMMLDPL